MKLLKLKIDKCGDCPYCHINDYNGDYECENNDITNSRYVVKIKDINEILDNCPLPDKK